MEVDAASKFGAIFAYDADQRTGAAHYRTFPKLEDDTPVTVRSAGHVHEATLRQAKAWAARWCENREQREMEWKRNLR
ncbi:MAG: hypothetical protein JWN34_3700 [Bryobacterales bacterium]|nr:hypothetical protein [Bryobacterales bacterium]